MCFVNPLLDQRIEHDIFRTLSRPFYAGIIFGQIVDAVSNARSEREDLINQLESTCFVCSLSKTEFQNKDLDFGRHINREHSPVAYLSFFINLDKTKQRDYTGMQTNVQQCLDRGEGDTQFLPLKRSLELDSRRKELNVRN